ncbi:hypothetical protein KDU71_02280 [Carboxylicivirga sediminis]|uniref:Uncharacterized protein n=1 Tax=Carboxylicivirga sediminis TaxID=2006564 RepID=A0A941EZM2_9BACT|nr:hypothetical protein [Carboxylicivirga sediminis]MBR8534371.1 hypothetical protein [Carboxylicivirga sediminis]
MTEVNRILVFVMIVMLLSACYKSDNKFEHGNFVYPATLGEWKKIEIPGRDVIQAVYGSIDDTLVAMTCYDLYYSVDKGKSWKHTFKTNHGLSSFHFQNDTIMAYEGYIGQNIEGESGIEFQQAGLSPLVYSIDYGQRWNLGMPAQYHEVHPLIGNVYDAKRKVNYRVKDVLNGSENFAEIEYQVIQKICDDEFTQVAFPLKCYIENLYIDKEDRLYVCLGHYWKFYKEISDGKISIERPGVIYYIDIKKLQ